MKKTFINILFLTLCIPHIQAQESPQNYTITGKVIDSEDGEPLEYATIILSPKSSGDIIGGITDKRGRYNLEVPKGEYDITIEFLSYKSKTFSAYSIINDTHLGTIRLKVDAEALETVEIKGEKKIIEQKLGKLVYNVTKDIANDGSTVIDIMNNIPSVFVENDTPTIRGQVATVLINGRTSSMTKSEVLKSLPAGSIEKIEVIKNPGAQYNASFTSIINIILKKGKDEGLNSSITGSLGHKNIYGGLLTLNHKSKKVNFFTNTSYNHRNIIKLSNSENEYFANSSTSSFLNEDSEFDSKNKTFYTTIGADFYLTKKTTLTTSINYSKLDHDSETIADTNIFDNSMSPSSSNERLHDRNFDNKIIDLNVNLEHKFTKERHKLSLNFINSNDKESSNNIVTNSNNNYTNLLYNENSKSTNYETNLKYIYPINDKSWISTGYDLNSKKTLFEGTITNNVDYKENIHATYIEYENQSNKFYYGIGIRGEFSKISIDYLNTNINQKNNFNDFFPIAVADYTINDSESISFYYSRDIFRTKPSQLQPFEERFSETSSYIGNENLKPMYANGLTLSYSLFGDKFTFVPELFYTKFNDWHQNVTMKQEKR